MKRLTTKILAALLALIMLVGMIPATALAADGDMTISVSAVSGLPGATVTVKIALENNPGIASIKLNVAFDESIATLSTIEYNTAMGGQSLPPQTMASPATLTWVSPFQNFEGDATFATLTFVIAEDAEENAISPITITYDPNDIYDMAEDNIPCTVVEGSIKVLNCVPGDINGDLTVNNKDLTRMFQYIANWDVEVNEPALDTNGDGSVNNKDLTRLFQYLAGWDVEIHCGTVTSTKCPHQLTAVAAKAATCTEAGNTAYWSCSLCGKLYSDANASAETALVATVIEATGHVAVIDPAVEPTYESTGLTEGSHCSKCNEVLKAQTVLPALQKTEYSITYHIANNDTYLAGIEIDNPNPVTYTSEDGLVLLDLIVPGYIFEGWYDGAGSNGALVKEYPAGTKGNRTLYAKWTKTEYTVMFESDLIPVDSTTYTVDTGAVLPTPKLDGYIFVGWSDDEGDILKKIPAGTIGTKTYKANWLAERNQARAYNQVGEPILYEDDGVILMIYEIGEIINVPLQVIEDFGKINSDGVEKTVTKTYSKTTEQTEMKNYTDTVSNATTESFGWTLSSEWSDSVSVSEEWAEEHGMTVEEAEEVCTNESSNWYVSSGSSGTDTTETVESTDVSTVQTTTRNNKNYSSKTDETRQDYSAESTVESKVSSEVSAEYMGVEASVSAEVSAGMTAKEEVGYTSTTNSGHESESGSSSEAGKVASSGTSTSSSASWNSESGCGGSSSITNTSSVSTAIAETISQKTGYGKEYIQTENQGETMDTSSSTESSKEYSSGVSFSIVESEEVTETYTTSNTMSGYHRWVMAGTAHVFAIVGYDIAANSYFVSTYSIMDEHTYPYEDYSYSSAAYNDNQTSIIPFEAPDDLEIYVHERIGRTDGLEVSAAGVITNYTGTEEMVIIPEYATVENLDGTTSVIKVTGISATAFAGNESIKAVILSDFITDIPSSVDENGVVHGAFEGCTSLIFVEGKGITSVGENAFKNCPALKNCELGENVDTLGKNAFEGSDSFIIKASNAAVVEAALASGAKNIVVGVSDSCTNLNNMTLTVPAGTESFTFYGYGKTFNNLFIESNAATTNIYRATFNSTSKAPLKLSSANVTLQEVVATAPEIALALSAETTNLALYGESFITCEGENAMLSKSIVFSQVKAGYYSHLTVSGNALRYGTYTNDSYITIANGYLTDIDEATFNKYLAGMFTVTFDANGGAVTETSRTCFYGIAIGTLPVPTRDYYTFAGWYTAADGGVEVTADTALSAVENITLYAHWTINPTSVWVLSTEVPEGAEVVNEKWTYDLTTNITSDVAEVEGYELYDTTSEWGEFGAWSAWSTTAKTASDSTDVETKTVTDVAGYTQYRYMRYANKTEGRIHWCPTLGEKYFPDGEWVAEYTSWSTTRKSVYDSTAGTCSCHGSIKSYGTSSSLWYYEYSRWIAPVTHTEYRYRVRELIYTYYLTKTEAMESATEVTATENISNVYKWVQYRAK